MLGVALKFIAIGLFAGLVYVSVKRALFPPAPRPEPPPRRPQASGQAADLVFCTACKTWVVPGAACDRTDCVQRPS